MLKTFHYMDIGLHNKKALFWISFVQSNTEPKKENAWTMERTSLTRPREWEREKASEEENAWCCSKGSKSCCHG